MKFLTIALIVLLSIISIKCQEECVQKENWKNYKESNGLEFKCAKKEKRACENYQKSLNKLVSIQKQRADLPYTIGETSAMHLNLTDYQGIKVDKSQFAKRRIVNRYVPGRSINQIPKSFNWVDQGFNTPVRQQGDCGSCYSFAAAGAVEAQNYICNRDRTAYSEQYFLDCSAAANGCGGSDPSRVADLASTASIPSRTDYEYILQDCSPQEWDLHKAGRIQRDCIQNKQCARQNRNGFRIDTVEHIQQGNEDHLLIALYETGPILVVFSAENSIQQYRNGIYDGNDCNPDKTNHAVLLVGYTPDYYIIKNSWGSNWGHSGYLHMKRRSNHRLGTCGILDYNQVVRKNGCRNV